MCIFMNIYVFCLISDLEWVFFITDMYILTLYLIVDFVCIEHVLLYL